MPRTPVDRSVAAVDRTLSILDAFVEGGGSRTLSQLEEQTGLFKSVICRYMLSFERSGYILKVGEAQYQLGPKAAHLGSTYDRALNLSDVVMPVLEMLAAETTESASFYVHDNGKRLCLYRVDSPRSLRVSVQPGSTLPIDKSATGQVFKLYAVSSTPAPDALGDSHITASSNVGPDETSSMSIPIFGLGDRLLGALTVSGPTSRFNPVTQFKARQKLLGAAQKLSVTLGARPATAGFVCRFCIGDK